MVRSARSRSASRAPSRAERGRIGLIAACWGLARLPNLVLAPGAFLVIFSLAFLAYGCGALTAYHLRSRLGLAIDHGRRPRRSCDPAPDPAFALHRCLPIRLGRARRRGRDRSLRVPARRPGDRRASRSRHLPAVESPDVADGVSAAGAGVLPRSVLDRAGQRDRHEGGARRRRIDCAGRARPASVDARPAGRPARDLRVESAAARRDLGQRPPGRPGARDGRRRGVGVGPAARRSRRRPAGPRHSDQALSRRAVPVASRTPPRIGRRRVRERRRGRRHRHRRPEPLAVGADRALCPRRVFQSRPRALVRERADARAGGDRRLGHRHRVARRRHAPGGARRASGGRRHRARAERLSVVRGLAHSPAGGHAVRPADRVHRHRGLRVCVLPLRAVGYPVVGPADRSGTVVLRRGSEVHAFPSRPAARASAGAE